MAIYTDAVLLMMILLAVLTIVFVLVYRSHKKIVEENQTMLKQWTAQDQYMEGLRSFSEEVREMSSEVRKAAQVFESDAGRDLSQQLHMEQACLDSCNALLSMVQSGNPVADALLFSKTAVCQNLNIRFEVSRFQIPENKMTEIELTSLIGNLLDNAIEAAHAASDPHPFVTLHCDFRSGILLIRVKNTKVSTARPIETNMQTTKLNKDYHGLGLHILSSIVKKYDGTMKMTDQGDTFQASVSLVLG